MFDNFFITRFLSVSFFKTYAAWLLLPIVTGIFSMFASNTNILLIILGLSALFGIFLLTKPIWNVNLVIVLGLFIGFIVLFFGEFATKLVWSVSILGFILLLAALYKLFTEPHVAKSTPLFVWIALLFLFYAVIDTALQLYSAKEMITAFKRYFQVWGLLFGLCWLGFSKEHIEQWHKTILTICLLQLPFCLYERLVLVPIRETYVETNPGLEPMDVIAGTFGSSMFGGGADAEMSTSLIIVFAFLLSRYKSGLLSIKQLFWLSCVLLSPLVTGEAKIVVILFPLMIFTLYRTELITRPVYGIGILIFGSLFTVLAFNAYMLVTNQGFDELIGSTLQYNVYEMGYGNNYLNRTTVLTFWWNHQSLADPLSFLFGHGIGSAESGSGDALGGHMDTRYQGYGIGLTGMSMLLWEVGVVGVSLFYLILIAAWACANRTIKLVVDPKIRADISAIQAAIVLFGFFPVYKASLLSLFALQVMFTGILGYLAWLYKRT